MNCCAKLNSTITADERASTDVSWRADIESLMFWIEPHSASCAVHRQAFRTLMRRNPTPQDCLAYFDGAEHAFRAAAATKIVRNLIPPGTNLHLTSRDIARKLIEPSLAQAGDDR